MAFKLPASLIGRFGEHPKAVSIVGFGRSVYEFPASGAEMVWSINDASRVHWYIGPDMVVAMDDWKRDVRIDPKYVEFISSLGVPVCGTKAYKQWPCLFAYPVKEVVGMLGRPWLDNTCSYALALAIYLGIKEINLYGFDFWTRDTAGAIYDATEVAKEKYGKVPAWFAYYMSACTERRRLMEPGGECVSYLIGFARGRGLKVNVPAGTALMDLDREQYLYGYERQPDFLLGKK